MDVQMLVLLTLTALQVSTAQARPQAQDGRAVSPDQSAWQPSLEKDKWRAFKPQAHVTKDRWWEMRLDDLLWQVPRSSGEPTSNSVHHDVDTSASAVPLPSNPPSLLPASSPRPRPPEQSQSEGKAKSNIASQVAAIAAAAKALLKVKKSNSTSDSNNKAVDSVKPTQVTGPNKEKLPGETGYLRPFYRKGDNNPFVDEDDTLPFYGAGMNWRNGRPYLPVLHKDVAPSVSVSARKVAVEGGVSASVNLPTSPSVGTGHTLAHSDESEMSDTEKPSNKHVPGTAEILTSARTANLANNKAKQQHSMGPVQQHSMGPAQQHSMGPVQQHSMGPDNKAQQQHSMGAVKASGGEMPQSDQPFVDWPHWDSSLFDEFLDEANGDKDKDKDVKSIEERKESVSIGSSEKKVEKLTKIQPETDHNNENDKTEIHASSDNDDEKDYEYDEDDYDYDYDDEDDAESDDDDESGSDDSEDDSSEENDNESVEESSRSSINKHDNISDDDYDDSYYYDDDDDDSDDDDDDDDDDGDDEDDDNDDEEDDDLSEWKEDSYEVLEKQDGAITISPIKTTTTTAPRTATAAPRTASRQKRLDWDKVSLSPQQLSHDTHYNKGVIYDAPPPQHGAHTHTDTHLDSEGEKDDTNVQLDRGTERDKDKSIVDNNPTRIRLRNTAGSSAQFEPTNLHTESDASTSPNPRPPIVTGGVSHTTTTSTTPTTPSTTSTTTTTPTTSTTTSTTTEAVQPKEMHKLADGDLEHLPVSYPLEFCEGDFECRAGRTCEQGMCKCVPLSWCEHSVAVEEGFLATDESDVSYLPVCGTDGNRYRSHCHLHRTACIARTHIRVDRHGAACLPSTKSHQSNKRPVHMKAKSWLVEQEQLLQEDQNKQKQLRSDQAIQNQQDNETKIVIPKQSIVHFPNTAVKDEITSSVKKDGENVASSEGSGRPLGAKENCTWSEMNEFKDALLSYYCHKFVEPNCPLEVKTERQYLSMLMYSYYDKDFDYFLSVEELNDKERDEHFNNYTVRNCHLHDFVKFADTIGAQDGKLTITEFSKAFELLNPTEQTPTSVEVIRTLASAGNGLELKCGIESNSIIWKKQGAQLSDDKRSHQLMVFDDGALFFSKVGLHHVGNYTCMDVEDPGVSQIHRLRVQTMPKVTVTPITQTASRGLDIELKCHAEGIPKPTLHWNKGNSPLHTSDRTSFYYDGGHVVINDANPETDSGTYTCIAHNQAGITQKSVSVSVLSQDTPQSKVSYREAGTFVVFHHQGITAYDPMHCRAKHKVNGMFGNFKFIPDAMDEPLTLCQPAADCQWGSAVQVGKDFIYASQPDENRVVVVEASGSWLPIQVIHTDARPGQMWYVKHLDQVWVLCGGNSRSEGSSIIVVIRDASQHIQHRSVHTRPVGNHFDMVKDLFIAPPNDLDHEFDYGYVAHKGQKGLFKINLEDMSYTKAVDLSSYGCVPTHLAFVPIGGHIVIQCVSASDQHSLQLILDYLTDTVTSTISLSGQPMTSPDSRHLITVDKLTGRVTVASISEEGVMATTYEVTVSASISDVAFMPAETHPGYDLILTSADDDDVIVMNLVTGKVEKISGSMYASSGQAWHPSGLTRHIATGDTLSSFLMTPARSSLDILDITFRQVECEFSNSDSNVILHIPSWQTS